MGRSLISLLRRYRNLVAPTPDHLPATKNDGKRTAGQLPKDGVTETNSRPEGHNRHGPPYFYAFRFRSMVRHATFGCWSGPDGPDPLCERRRGAYQPDTHFKHGVGRPASAQRFPACQKDPPYELCLHLRLTSPLSSARVAGCCSEFTSSTRISRLLREARIENRH